MKPNFFLGFFSVYLFIVFRGDAEKVQPGRGVDTKNSVAHQRNLLQVWNFSLMTQRN